MNILALNGGGAKGYFSLCFLSLFEQRFNLNFQLYSGVSTGAIIAIGLALGIEPKLMKEYYRKMLPEIFDKNFWYPAFVKYDIKNLRKCLQSVFGDKKLRDCKTAVQIPATNCTYTKGKIYKSFEIHDRDVSCVEAVVRSCAAPTYFLPPKDGEAQYIDGGVALNNPSILAFWDAMKYNNSVRNNILNIKLSIVKKQKEITKCNASAIGPLFNCSLEASDSYSEYGAAIMAEHFGSEYCLIENQGLDFEMDDCSADTLKKQESLAEESFFEFLKNKSDFIMAYQKDGLYV